MSNKTESGGVTFLGLLTILFIGLKLTHCIDWPWIWVLSPMWIGAAVAVLILAIVLVVALIKDKRG